jgi:LuxR family maltose regulon positive regulatory protein
MLAALAAANLFLTPLDERRDWYRYHGLFADLLASGLPPARRIELHRAAASWFSVQGLLLEGIRHHLAAHEHEKAAALMERAADLTLARGEFRTFTSWCDALPAPTLSAHRVLGLMRAWALFFLGDIAGAEATLSRLDDDGQRDDRHGARRACLEAWFANRRDRPDSEALARRAIAGIPESDSVFLSLAFTTLGESLAGRDVHEALAAFEEAHRLARTAGRSALLAGTVYSLATTDLVLGRRREAEALCRQAIAEQTGRSTLTPPWLGMVHLPLGMALFEADELIAARQHIATGQELCDRAGLRVTMLGAAEWYEILAMHALGEGRRAWRRLEAVRREAERHGIARVARAMVLLAAELLLLEGDPAGALARLEALPAPESEVLGATRDRGRLVEARVLLALDRPVAALEVANALALEQRADGRLGRLMATLVVIASASSRAGDQDGSSRALAEALTHAADQGYRRVFRDPVLPVDRLLPRVRHVAPTFVDSLTSGGGPAGRPAPGSVLPRVVALEDGGGGSIERLSVREIKVLRLVAAGLSNEEIGRELFVSSGTAKWHVHNILGKLGSRNRAAVAARARTLGLI